MSLLNTGWWTESGQAWRFVHCAWRPSNNLLVSASLRRSHVGRGRNEGSHSWREKVACSQQRHSHLPMRQMKQGQGAGMTEAYGKMLWGESRSDFRFMSSVLSLLKLNRTIVFPKRRASRSYPGILSFQALSTCMQQCRHPGWLFLSLQAWSWCAHRNQSNPWVSKKGRARGRKGMYTFQWLSLM